LARITWIRPYALTRSGIATKDVEPFIRYFMPTGVPVTKATLHTAVRHLHLAFKGMETEEIYDVLMAQLVATVRGYDPRYKEKVQQVVERISNELSQRAQFSVADVNCYVDFDCHRHLRLLVRHGFLTAVTGQDGRLSIFTRTGQWPPPASFLKQPGAIGLTYYIQKWFRFQPAKDKRIWLRA
jgi:hypothetical protein